MAPPPAAGAVYHEDCDCPFEDAEAWLSVLKCPSAEPQIQQDFSAFPSIELQRVRQEVPSRFSDRGVIHYAIIDNQLHRRALGRYTDFKMFSDEMLLSLTRKVRSSHTSHTLTNRPPSRGSSDRPAVRLLTGPCA